MKISTVIFLGIIAFSNSIAFAKPIQIVAAENFYGEMAQQIGGSYVHVASIMNNPNQDPHLFSVSPATAKALTKADIIIYNGLNYDPWMTRLLSVDSHPSKIIIIADLLHKQIGDNPHIWYDPETMPIYANKLTATLIALDPEHAKAYQVNLVTFNKNFQVIKRLVASMYSRFKNTPVLATEPVFGYMSSALGLKMYGESFQLRIMNDTEPSAKDISDFETMLTSRSVKVLIYNNQVSDTLTDTMKNLAKQVNIPIVGVSETQPLNTTYIDWMVAQLSDLEKALTH